MHAPRETGVWLCHDGAVTLPRRLLGESGIDVSIMSLGSWRTYERLSQDEGIAVMRAAREAGIDFLDDARYDDETGTAPIPTGWSEVVFAVVERLTHVVGPLIVLDDSGGVPVVVCAGDSVEQLVQRYNAA